MKLRLDRSRTTRDVGLRATALTGGLLDRLREAARLALEERLVFEVEPDSDHPILEADGLPYNGRRFRVGVWVPERPAARIREFWPVVRG